MQVDSEIEPLKAAWRASKREEAMRGVEREVEAEVRERRRELEDLETRAVAAKAMIMELDAKVRV